MKSLSTTAEETARKEYEVVVNPERVRVKLPVILMHGVWLPAIEGDEPLDVVEAIFTTFTYGDNYAIEKATAVRVDTPDKGAVVMAIEPNEFRRLMVKKCLLSWSLDIEIEKDEDGWMTPECYERVGKVAGPLLESLVDKFQETTIVTEEDERIIDRQSAILFSEHSRGVSNACEAVSAFCTYAGFYDKFGLNQDSLPHMPFRDYLLMKIMMQKEGENMRTSRPKSPGSRVKIAGPGGRTRASQGKVIAG